MSAIASADTEEVARELLSRVGVADSFRVEPLSGGRNNRVYRLRVGETSYLLKRYFHHPDDPRDRLGQEFDFLCHLRRVGCALAAKPLIADAESHAALLEFIEGSRLGLTEIDAACVAQACHFYRETNSLRPPPPEIRPASEACFSIQQHVETTQRRVDRLAELVVRDETDTQARDFVESRLLPTWQRILSLIRAEWPLIEERQECLSADECCLSPSDFGFHNALRQADGTLRFVDFEYAGRDDPAKLVCDFANQPDMLLSRALSDPFLQTVLSLSPSPGALARRIVALEPLYQVKWACICLNDFLPAGRTRYRFTDGDSADHRTRREFQLTRAVEMLGRTGNAV